MPYLKLITNTPISGEQSTQLLTQLSQCVARETGKSENYVMVELIEQSTMLFAGNDKPLAYLECKSIGLTSGQAKSLSAAISQLLDEQLQIVPDRVYIEFSNCPAEFWGWNSTTFG